tara:strand:+ start:4282 stop:4734 length:453 start_codon:yes stop_codon:yes gene_type:complete
MKRKYEKISREKFADRFPDGFDFNIKRILAISPLTITEMLETSRKPDVVMWRKIYASFLWMNGGTLREIGEMINKDHATVLACSKYVYKQMNGIFINGADGAIKSKKIKQALLDIIFCKDVSFVRSESVCADEYVGLLALENKLNEKLKH